MVLVYFKYYLVISHSVPYSTVATCVDKVPASNEWIRSEKLGPLRLRREDGGIDGLLAVMPNYTFSCEGEVMQWVVQWNLRDPFSSGKCEFIFDFHVLRPTGSCNVTSIGKNRMVVETYRIPRPRNFISIFNISESDRIRVREGDMVGLAVTYNQKDENSCSYRRVTIAEQNDTYSPLTNEVHYIRESFDPDYITEFELECSREHSDNDDEFTRNDRDNFEGTDFRVYRATPLINAVVGKHLYPMVASKMQFV